MAKILLVDDTVFFRKMYCDILYDAGYEVIEASDGIEGIEKAIDTQPDLILLDMAMPKLDGLLTLERLKGDSRTNHIEIIVLSSKDAPTDIKEALQQGAADYLIKTENKPAEVIEKIKTVLASAASRVTTQVEPPADTSRISAYQSSRPEFTRQIKQYRISLRDREEDADMLIEDCRLPQRLWCPKCQEELILELTPDTGLGIDPNQHRFKARLVCSRCGEEF